MVERYVFVKLKDEYATPEGRREVAQQTATQLDAVPGPVRVTVGVPDEKAEGSWDLSIAVLFNDHEDVAPYLVHAEHRRYVDEYLKPRMEFIKYWNFHVVNDGNK